MRYRVERFLHAQRTYHLATPIQTLMREKLLQMIKEYKQKEFVNIFEFGCGHGELTQMLEKELIFNEYICNDINNYGLEFANKKIQIQYFDMNDLGNQDIFQKRFHLITSNACLQWLDFSLTLHNLKEMLLNESVLLISTFGSNNFKEVKKITGFGLDYKESDSIKEQLKKDFTLLAWHEENIIMQFQNPLEVFYHMKHGGVNALGVNNFKRSWLKEYEMQFQNHLTYHIICFLAKKK